MAMAVNRRARVTAGDEKPVQAGSTDLAVLDAVCRITGLAIEAPLPIQDTRAFFARHGSGTAALKLGIGSSAALSVALCKALLPAATTCSELQESALQAHRAFQRGAGSGADIAASVHGGVIRYEMEHGRVASKSWPPGLFFRLLWSGVPSSTTNKLANLKEREHKDSFGPLHNAAVDIADAWSEAAPARLLESFLAYVAVLKAFDIDHQLGIFDAGHERLLQQATGQGLVYKPCGAGGGDLGIALGTDPTRLDEFVTTAVDNGFYAVDLAIDEQGAAFCESES